MTLLCTFSWVVGLLVNSHDRHWLRGSVNCDALSNNPQLQVESVASGCQINLDVALNNDLSNTISVIVKVHARCPPIEVEAWTFSVSSPNGAIQSAFQPTGFGRITTTAFEEPFPAMQFSGLIYNEGCIYLGVHDGRAFPKKFKFENNTVSAHITGSSEVDQSTSLPLKVEVKNGLCNWKTLSDIYVAFARNTEWYARGLWRQERRPAFISDIPVWVNTHWQEKDVLEKTGGSPLTVLERVKRFQNLIGTDIPVLLHWYEWDRLGYTDDDFETCGSGAVCGFDSHYPEYFPARKGFTEAVSGLAERNVTSVPYINGRIYDQNIDTWSSRPEPQASACRGKSGQIHTEDYGNGVKFAPMCPATNFWQQAVADFAQGVILTAPVGGIYIDQLAAAEPVHCYNPAHSHVHGGGSSWTSGHAQMLKLVRSQLGDGKLIITESNVEHLIGSVDTFLTLVAYSEIDEIVPAFQYVYPRGVFVTAGAEFFTQDLTENGGTLFVSKIMKQFMHGTQIGWFSLGGRDNQIPSMTMLEALADRKYGRQVDLLIKLLRLRMDPVVSTFFKHGSLMDHIGSYGFLWIDVQGALGIICNADETRTTQHVNLDLSQHINSPHVDVKLFVDGSWESITTSLDPHGISLSVEVLGLSCTVIHVFPTPNVSTTIEIATD